MEKNFSTKKNTKCVETKHISKQSVIISLITAIIAHKIVVIKIVIGVSGTVGGGLGAESPIHSTHVVIY